MAFIRPKITHPHDFDNVIVTSSLNFAQASDLKILPVNLLLICHFVWENVIVLFNPSLLG